MLVSQYSNEDLAIRFSDLDKNLGLLIEELTEASLEASKCRRFGMKNRNPEEAGAEFNYVKLEKELGDVILAIRLLVANNNLDEDRIIDYGITKETKLERWYNVENNDVITK